MKVEVVEKAEVAEAEAEVAAEESAEKAHRAAAPRPWDACSRSSSAGSRRNSIAPTQRQGQRDRPTHGCREGRQRGRLQQQGRPER